MANSPKYRYSTKDPVRGAQSEARHSACGSNTSGAMLDKPIWGIGSHLEAKVTWFIKKGLSSKKRVYLDLQRK